MKKFEENMAGLESLVAKMEEGEMPLSDALKAFEEGSMLLKACQKQLAEAELKVEKIVASQGGGVSAEPFNPAEEE